MVNEMNQTAHRNVLVTTTAHLEELAKLIHALPQVALSDLYVGASRTHIARDAPVIYYRQVLGASTETPVEIKNNVYDKDEIPESGELVPGVLVLGGIAQPYVCGMVVNSDYNTPGESVQHLKNSP